MATNTKESGLETLIVNYLVNQNEYEQGQNSDYNKDYAIDETRLFRFLEETQKEKLEMLGIYKSDSNKAKLLNRLQGEITKNGVIEVLRNGLKIYPVTLELFYLTPSEANETAKALYEKNIFSVTRHETCSRFRHLS